MINEKLTKKTLKKYGQENLIKIMNELNEEEKKELLEQVSQINLEEIKKLYEDTKLENRFEKYQITPIDYIDKENISKEEKKKLQILGDEIIKNNQYAVITMAGGQGTRLGFNGPKGTFKLDFETESKYIFEILAEALKKAGEQYNTLPYWYIMTSDENDRQTEIFFEEHDYFGYNKEKIQFFKQDNLPLLTENGELVIKENKIKVASNGNGGLYKALIKQHILDDMKSKNIKWIYVCGVDNIMVNPIDPLFIGLTIKQNMPIASKSVVKACPEEKVGVFCKRNGKPGIVEYIELSEKMRIECNEKGELIYGDANIISHLFSLDALEKISNQNLEYHLAIKNGLYKFETFIFDGFKYAEDMLVMRVKREEEFAPIKNKSGVDSPESAIYIYSKKHL